MNSRLQLKILIRKILKCSEVVNGHIFEVCQVFKSCVEMSPPQTGSGVAVTKCQNDLGCVIIQAVFLLKVVLSLICKLSPTLMKYVY